LLAGSTIIGQGIVVLASPVISRLYSPDDLGLLAVYSSILGIMAVIASLRYETVIPLPEDDEDAATVLALALCVVVLVSLLTGALSLFFGRNLAALVKTPKLSSYLWLLPLGVLLIGTYQVFNSWAIRKRSFGSIARTKLNQSISSVSAQIGLGAIKFGPLGLIIGQVLGLAAGSLTLIRLFRKQFGLKIFSSVSSRIMGTAKRYIKFPTLAALAATLNSVTIYFPAILLAALYGPKIAGWYALAQRAIGTPLNIVGQSISQVYISRAAPLARSSPARLMELFNKLFIRLLAVGILITVPIVFVAPKLFALVFGAEWGESGAYVPGLAPFFVAQFVSLPLGGTLDILERQSLFLIREAFRAVIILAAFLVMYLLELPPRKAMILLGLAGLIGYAFYQLSLWLAIKQHAQGIALRENEPEA